MVECQGCLVSCTWQARRAKCQSRLWAAIGSEERLFSYQVARQVHQSCLDGQLDDAAPSQVRLHTLQAVDTRPENALAVGTAVDYIDSWQRRKIRVAPKTLDPFLVTQELFGVGPSVLDLRDRPAYGVSKMRPYL